MLPPEPATLVPHDVLDRVKRSAGGVLWRSVAGRAEIALVHRARRPAGQWSLPKGGIQAAESTVTAALREVREETGYAVRAEQLLGTVVRRSRRGRSKLSVYWLMRPVGGRFRPNREIDDLVWVVLDEAAELLAGRPEAILLDAVREVVNTDVAAAV